MAPGSFWTACRKQKYLALHAVQKIRKFGINSEPDQRNLSVTAENII
jgi:hypothetical protein